MSVVKYIWVSIIGIGLSFDGVAQMQSDTPQLGGKTAINFQLDTVNTTYQIGDEWGKLPFSPNEMLADSVYAKTALATARVGGATGFYIGKFAGEHVMGTNNHVMGSRFQCGRVSFPASKLALRCKKFLGTWKNLDLTLFTVSVNSKDDEEILSGISNNFAFHESIDRETPLITSGFGIAENSSRKMMINRDDDCISFSAAGEYRLMADPDDLNTGPNKVWSFAVGCDVSHGDSGSAMIDRVTGKIVGLIWTGRIPKATRIQDSAYLRQIIAEDNKEEIWGQLSYAVPAEKIKEILELEISSGKLKPATAEIISAMISDES